VEPKAWSIGNLPHDNFLRRLPLFVRLARTREVKSWARNICTIFRYGGMTGRQMWRMTCAARKRRWEWCRDSVKIANLTGKSAVSPSLAEMNDKTAARIIGSALERERSSLSLLMETLTARMQRGLRSHLTFFFMQSAFQQRTRPRATGR